MLGLVWNFAQTFPVVTYARSDNICVNLAWITSHFRVRKVLRRTGKIAYLSAFHTDSDIFSSKITPGVRISRPPTMKSSLSWMVDPFRQNGKMWKFLINLENNAAPLFRSPYLCSECFDWYEISPRPPQLSLLSGPITYVSIWSELSPFVGLKMSGDEPGKTPICPRSILTLIIFLPNFPRGSGSHGHQRWNRVWVEWWTRFDKTGKS